MIDKTDEVEDKAVGIEAGRGMLKKTRRRRKFLPESTTDERNAGRQDDGDPAEPSPPAPLPDRERGGVEIQIRAWRQWTLNGRVLKPGERVRTDARTAATIVAAGYANYTEG